MCDQTSMKELTRVYFGAKMTRYTGRNSLNHVGREGVLVVYDYAESEGECLAWFYFDEGESISWVRHAHSSYEASGGTFTATSIYSGTVKEYDVSRAVETGPEVFRGGRFHLDLVPERWQELYLNVFPRHEWAGEPVIE